MQYLPSVLFLLQKRVTLTVTLNIRKRDNIAIKVLDALLEHYSSELGGADEYTKLNSEEI